MSKSAECWIRHNSKQQPVDDHVEVEIRTRGGDYEVCKASGFTWDATAENQIMAYRLHKPAEQVEACSKPELRISLPENYGEIIGGSVEGPIQWRDRITEIDATTQALTAERAELVQKLDREGFALIGRINELLTDAEQKHEDMSDWRNWKIGDCARLIDKVCEETCMKPGSVGEITRIDEYDIGGHHVKIDDHYWPLTKNLSWHSRPSA